MDGSRKIKQQALEQGNKQNHGEPAYDYSARPLWEIAQELASQIPPEEWEKVPADASINLDHYLYGAPRKRTEEEKEKQEGV